MLQTHALQPSGWTFTRQSQAAIGSFKDRIKCLRPLSEKVNHLNDIEGEKGLLKFLVLKKKKYRMMRNSKNCQTSEMYITSVIIFQFTKVAVGLSMSPCLDHVFVLAFFCLIWILSAFQVTPTPPVYVFPLAFQFNLVFFCSKDENIFHPSQHALFREAEILLLLQH